MFAERLKELRKKTDMTQIEFAKKFNIANGTVGNWESGKRQPDYATISKIADFFHVSTDYLLGRTDNPSSPAPVPEKELSNVDIMISTEAKDLSDKDKQEILTFIQYKKFQKETGSSSTSPGARTFTTADFEDHTERIAAFGGMEDTDEEPLTT